MTIYKKLQEARIRLQATPLNKSGVNAFAKDVLPEPDRPIIKIIIFLPLDFYLLVFFYLLYGHKHDHQFFHELILNMFFYLQ